MTADERLERYARLTVEVGANIGEGQTLWLTGHLDNAPFLRAVTRAAYERGAKFVGTEYIDGHNKRARLEFADEGTLGWTPPWLLT
ncbi:MAG TPA: aminopeptidase, partial [Longimicrobium sp.]|nr:aminopeptidase [Longimicrobium sp.]